MNAPLESYETKPSPMIEEYRTLDQAALVFNLAFGLQLDPMPIITLNNRARRASGFCKAKAFKHREHEVFVSEVALNPDTFGQRSDKAILSTLAHELVHEWQNQHGTPSRGGYHNAQWANTMQRIGLMPSTTGKPGGKRTGGSVSHYIVNGGLFDQVASEFLKGVKLQWQGNPNPPCRRDPSKVKYTCPGCGQNAWAKDEALLICGNCRKPMKCEEELRGW